MLIALPPIAQNLLIASHRTNQIHCLSALLHLPSSGVIAHIENY